MRLLGDFSPPGDKSVSHRLALMALLAAGCCEVVNMSTGLDVRSSLKVAAELGVGVQDQGEKVILHGAGGKLSPSAELDCGNSGTTMRLLIGLLAGRPGRFVLDGDESLRQRPMERVAGPLRSMGADVICQEGRCPVIIAGGRLKGLEYRLPVASAQLKSAILLAGLQADGLTTVIEPAPSRDHSERLIELMGGDISRSGRSWRVKASRLTLPPEFFVPGDPSAAAFFLCAAAVMPGSRVTAEKIMLNPTRIGFLKVLERMGARVEVETLQQGPEPWGRVTAGYSPGLKAVEVRPSEVPGLVDEVPILALAATQAKGVTRFQEVGELRIKETDRLAAVVGQLTLMGACLEVRGDDLLVHGPTPLTGPERLNSFGDHRMAMTLRLAGLLAGVRPPVDGEDCLKISYPGFTGDLERLLQ